MNGVRFLAGEVFFGFNFAKIRSGAPLEASSLALPLSWLQNGHLHAASAHYTNVLCFTFIPYARFWCGAEDQGWLYLLFPVCIPIHLCAHAHMYVLCVCVCE